MHVLLNEINKARDFNGICSRYDGDIDLVSGRYTIDAKSIMGIFSLDLSKPIGIVSRIVDEDVENRFFEEIEKFSC